MTKADTTGGVSERDRPVDEIEITEEMIEAGEEVLRENYLDIALPEEGIFRLAAEMVFRAMREAERQLHP